MGKVKRKATAEENRAFWADVKNCRDHQFELMHKLKDWLDEALELPEVDANQHLEILKAEYCIIGVYLRNSEKAQKANDPIQHLDVQNTFIKSYFRIIEKHFPDLAEKARPLIM